MQELMRVVLEAEGITVVTVDDSLTGLSLARTRPISALILDGQLPDDGTNEVLEGLAQDPRTAMIPVVLVTAGSPSLTTLSQVTATVHKPICSTTLIQAVIQAWDESESLAMRAFFSPPAGSSWLNCLSL